MFSITMATAFAITFFVVVAVGVALELLLGFVPSLVSAFPGFRESDEFDGRANFAEFFARGKRFAIVFAAFALGTSLLFTAAFFAFSFFFSPFEFGFFS